MPVVEPSDHSLLVAVCQMEVSGDVGGNLATIERLGAVAGARAAALTVYPEASAYPIGAAGPDLEAMVARDGDRVLDALRRTAKAARTTLVAGVFEQSGVPGKVCNVVKVFGPDGAERGSYRKIHLYDAFGVRESERFVAGGVEPFVFRLDGFTIGVMTCYDLRFPELARALVNRGADVLLVPAAWAQGALKEEHWDVLLRARAIENTAYVAAAAQCGAAFAARSVVLDPLGLPLAALVEAEGVAVAELRRDRLADVRRRLPVLAHRRLRVDLGDDGPSA